MALIKIINGVKGTVGVVFTLDSSVSDRNTNVYHRFGRWNMDRISEGNALPLNVAIMLPDTDSYEYKIYRKDEFNTSGLEIYSETITGVTSYSKIYNEKTLAGTNTASYYVELFKEGRLLHKTEDLKFYFYGGGGGPVSSDSSGSSPGN